MRAPATAPAATAPEPAQEPGAATATVSIAEGAPAAGASPTAAGQDVEKLAEKVWQVVRRKLALERERRRGVP